jgi:agmatine deiminase
LQKQVDMRLNIKPYLRQKLLMPAETAPHDACWMAWPSRSLLWGERLALVRREYALVARTIARFEPVIIVCREVDVAEVRRLCGDVVRIWTCPIDDSWIRDSGPTFLVGDRGGLAIADWAFNAWGGKYQPFADDAALKRRIADDLGIPLVPNCLIAEGGAVLSDGQGTVITTESCLLNANRSQGRDQASIEAELLDTLGANKIVWLPGDISEIETDGHIDCLGSIVAPGLVMIEDPATTQGARREVLLENRRALLAQTDACGRPFEIVEIPAAPALDIADPRHQPSYVNFYTANGAVVMPGHGVAADADALAAVAAAFPDRDVVQLVLEALPYGGGSIHCITQHQPSRQYP